MTHTRLHWLLLVGSTLLATGCYTTKIRTAKQPAQPTAEWDGKWHSGLIVGIAELSGPYTLSEVCPNGWAEIETETSFPNGLVGWFTFGIYNPQTVTVRCAAGGPRPEEPEAEPAPEPAPTSAPPKPDDAERPPKDPAWL